MSRGADGPRLTVHGVSRQSWVRLVAAPRGPRSVTLGQGPARPISHQGEPVSQVAGDRSLFVVFHIIDVV